MSDPKGKAIPEALSMFLVMLVLFGIDVFFIKSDLTILGDNFYSRFLSFVIIFMLIFFKKEHINTYGIVKGKKPIKKALLLGSVFSIVPFVCVSVVEIIFFKFYSPLAIVSEFYPPNMSYDVGGKFFSLGICTLIYFFTALFASCFKEMFFRGFLLHKFKKQMSFWSANVFQALLYTSFMMLKLIRNFTQDYYGYEIVRMAGFVIVFYIVHEIMTGIKWGMLAKVGGSTYLPIVDNFFYIFLANCVHIIDPSIKWMFMLHMLGVQGLSFAMVCIYCLYKSYFTNGLFNNRQNSETSDQAEIKETSKTDEHRYSEPHHRIQHESREESHHRHSESRKPPEPVYTGDIIKNTEKISPSQFKTIVSEAVDASRKAEKSHNGELSDEEIDDFLKDFGKPKHHYNPPKKQEPVEEATDDGDFDVDDFLKGFSENND